MLHYCDDHITASKKDPKEEEEDSDTKEESKPDATFPSFAAIAIALIAMGEEDVPPTI
jgi:26S proteasome regulatory subunit N1